MIEADWIQIGIASSGALTGAALWVARCFSKLVVSIEKLNINVAVIVEKVNSHEKRIERLEER